ncbi:hypothetical protein KPL74_18005 [Bacillus sp. NP157]|nr:hypothetical protein KPL74_18005 [Bacillus sp. NP157]
MRVSILGVPFLLLAGVPAAFAGTTCSAERYTFGNHAFPSHDEAMALCRQEEAQMTDAATGTYEHAAGCHDVGEQGTHGDWRYGRIALDVVARDSGEPYTFEGLWMCKPAM